MTREYKLAPEGYVFVVGEDIVIPMDPNNTEYKQFLADRAAGATVHLITAKPPLPVVDERQKLLHALVRLHVIPPAAVKGLTKGQLDALFDPAEPV